jgi:hypothetical protein
VISLSWQMHNAAKTVMAGPLVLGLDPRINPAISTY